MWAQSVASLLRFHAAHRHGPAALSGTQQLKSSNEPVCETTRDPRPMGILRQPSVANLGEAKHPLDHPYALLYLVPRITEPPQAIEPASV
jgi:hypothetical protein